MEEFLRGLLHDLARRCEIIKDRLTAATTDPEVQPSGLTAYQVVESVRRDTLVLLADASLGVRALLPNHLQQLKRWTELVTLVEAFPLPFVERYAQPDRRLTHLTQRLTDRARWPLPAPLVGAFSTQYYWTQPAFNLICASAAEVEMLLGLPDLCHELGHILLLRYEQELTDDFLQEVADYVAGEIQRVSTQQRPPEYIRSYHLLLLLWRDRWIREFVSDMVATYLVGPAFGWQHVRLCAGRGNTIYFPTLGQSAEHPADEARLRGILALLTDAGAVLSVGRIRTLWDEYMALSGQSPPVDYAVCYPQSLITSLARHVMAGCQTLNIRRFDEAGGDSFNVATLVGAAWDEFHAAPQTYAVWEKQSLDALWLDLGFGAAP